MHNSSKLKIRLLQLDFFFFQGTDTLSRKKTQKVLKSVKYT